jgi:serine protease Do
LSLQGELRVRFLLRTKVHYLVACIALSSSFVAGAGVTPELQHAIRDATFEVVMKKPEKDPVTYEKALPLDLLPFYDRHDAYRSVGTAFSLGHNNYVTAAHVLIAGISSQYGVPSLRRSDGTVFEIDQILKFSQHEDFVLFSLRNDPGPTGFEVMREPKMDEPVLAVGNALGEGIVIRDGLFTSETPEDQDGLWKWIRFSAAASPGNSGGPLLDGEGKVIGIVIGKSPNENLNYSLPIGRVLDGENLKARFDQRTLTSLPFLHGTYTYSYKDTFKLPLAWAAFADAFQSVNNRQIDNARSGLLNTYAETLFPKGPGADDILYEPQSNGFLPRLIAQQADGRWNAFTLDYHTTDLSGDGSVSVASAAGAIFLRLVRPDAAIGDAYYSDSKAFMDAALRALNLRRPVGPDQVGITSLGAARSDGVFTDNYGRKWQDRVWAVPFLDIYVVGLLLPTPDGYAAVVKYAPSALLHAVEKETQLLVSQVDVSYRGTLSQWQRSLQRHDLLPAVLKDVNLVNRPVWQLQTPRFRIEVPPDALLLTDKSPLTLTMGFITDGRRASWDIQEVRWNLDERQDVAIALWRRQRPPGSAKVDLRNRFASMADRRAPYDGSIDRETAEIYSLSNVLQVSGRQAGTVSADLIYGLTVYLNGHPTMQDALKSIQRVSAGTRVLEPGIGPDIARAPPVNTASDATLENIKREALASAAEFDGRYGPDIRGRHMADDLNDFFATVSLEMHSIPMGSSEADPDAWNSKQGQRRKMLQDYWNHYPALTHNRDAWRNFLSRNHLPAATVHSNSVLMAERALLAVLNTGIPTKEWGENAQHLLDAYINERTELVHSSALTPGDYRSRTSPCPVASAQTSGTRWPKYGRMTRSLEDFWPMESKRLGEEGTVFVTLKVSATGCAKGAAISGSSGFDMLDATVLQAFETMEFIPAGVNGAAVESTVNVPIVFKLSK